MIKSSKSLSGESNNSSGSSLLLHEANYTLCFDEEKGLNGDYALNESGKDERYWERRRKNNAAAKRSRERRRQHDMELELQIQKLKRMNSLLQSELITLRQKLSINDFLTEKVEQSQKYNANLEESSTISLISTPSDTPCVVSASVSSEEQIIEVNDEYTIISPQAIEALYKNTAASLLYHQNPLDLSCKLKNSASNDGDTIKNQLKAINRSNNQVIFDQKYWDRRRRNNEAVRKCRQNKRAKTVYNSKDDKQENEQIQFKIETISNELEKLKSQIKKPDQSASYQHVTATTMPYEHFVSRDVDRKVLKWKTKLIEANQADKEMC